MRTDMMNTQKFLRDADASGQSEARAIADLVRDAIESAIEDGEPEDHAALAAGMAEEFIGWGNALHEAGLADTDAKSKPNGGA